MRRIYVMDRDGRAFGMYHVVGDGKVYFSGIHRRIPGLHNQLQHRLFTDEELEARIKMLNLTKMMRCQFLKQRRNQRMPTEGW